MNRLLSKIIARTEDLLCRTPLLHPLTWNRIEDWPEIHLYAGDLRRTDPQYATHVGLTPFRLSPRTICADVTDPIPLPDGSVDSYQAEDVFEHIAYDQLVPVFDEVFRVLKPGGLFRLSVPDYRSDLYAERAIRNSDGDIVFDPGGGGSYVDGTVTKGGHLWFPTVETVEQLFHTSRFSNGGAVEVLHGYRVDGRAILKNIDHSKGPVRRTPDFDSRARNPRRPLSIVVDSRKKSCRSD